MSYTCLLTQFSLRLLPTNCVRACTSVPIECSWNASNDPEELYRAEVEFISPNDWLKELRHLQSDLANESASSTEYKKPETVAGMAYSKIHAVYPKQTARTLAQLDPQTFLEEERVRSVLGTVRYLRAQTSTALLEQLQPLVDSREKSKGTRVMAYWPLLKVVRLYTKARALSTGTVIVDLVSITILCDDHC